MTKFFYAQKLLIATEDITPSMKRGTLIAIDENSDWYVRLVNVDSFHDYKKESGGWMLYRNHWAYMFNFNDAVSHNAFLQIRKTHYTIVV